MVNKALVLIIDNSTYNFDEWTFSEIACVPLFKRAIFAGQKAGVNGFFILDSVGKSAEIEASLNLDKRIRPEINMIGPSNQTKEGKRIIDNMIYSFKVSFIIWCASFLGNKTTWRGSRFLLKKGGKIEKI